MSIFVRKDPLVVSQIIETVMREYARSASRQDWIRRLAGIGYAVRETEAGPVVETLPHHVEICALPAMPRAGNCGTHP